MSPNEIVRIEEKLNHLIKATDNFKDELSKVETNTREMTREIRQEFKAEILGLKNEHCERLNKHSEKIEKQGNDLSEIKGSSKTISFLISLFVSILGIVMGKIMK
jgi:uncharacterized protein YdcH (DUF465 family)